MYKSKCMDIVDELGYLFRKLKAVDKSKIRIWEEITSKTSRLVAKLFGYLKNKVERGWSIVINLNHAMALQYVEDERIHEREFSCKFSKIFFHRAYIDIRIARDIVYH